MAYEQKPNTFSLFRDNEERVEERKKFYREKGWDESKVPTYSGRFLLEDGTLLNIEATVIDGAKGKFFSGRAWKKKTDGGQSKPQPSQTQFDDDLSDIPF